MSCTLLWVDVCVVVVKILIWVIVVIDVKWWVFYYGGTDYMCVWWKL